MIVNSSTQFSLFQWIRKISTNDPTSLRTLFLYVIGPNLSQWLIYQGINSGKSTICSTKLYVEKSKTKTKNLLTTRN